MKKIIFIIIFILLCNIASGFEIKYLEVNNETLSIEPTINICTNTTSVFKIQRENYCENSTTITINYIQKTISKNNHSNNTQTTNISKTINKYTNSNTGNYVVNENGNISLIFQLNNQSLNWNFFRYCFNETENTTNTSQPEINNTINESINISINSTMNNTVNDTINITLNSTLNISINTTINKSLNINETKVNETENTSQIMCPAKLEIKTNKEIFNAGEKLEMQFALDYWISSYEITYSIELLDGTIVKNEYITTNNKTKTYTLKQSEEKEQTHKIIAKVKSECGVLEAEKIIVLKSEGDIKKEKETNITLEAKIEEQILEITIIANRGNSLKSLINVFLENKKGQKIGEQTKIYLESKESEAKIILKQKLPEEETFSVFVEGLGIYRELNLTNEQQKNNEAIIMFEKEEEKKEEKTKQESENITKTVLTSNVIRENVQASEIIETKTDKIEAVKAKKTIFSTNLLFAITIGSLFMIGISIYFRKHSAQKNL